MLLLVDILVKPSFITRWNKLFRITKCTMVNKLFRITKCAMVRAMEVPCSDVSLLQVSWQPLFAARSGPASVHDEALPPTGCSQPMTKLRGCTGARYLASHWAPLPGHLGAGVSCWPEIFSELHGHLRLFLPDPSSSPSPSQVPDLHHVWWISLTIPDPSPLYFHSQFLATNPLHFGFHHGVCFLENLKLHRHFLSIPLFICVLCTPATQFSLDVFIEHHLIIFCLAYKVLDDQISPYLSKLIPHLHQQVCVSPRGLLLTCQISEAFSSLGLFCVCMCWLLCPEVPSLILCRANSFSSLDLNLNATSSKMPFSDYISHSFWWEFSQLNCFYV